MLTSLCLHIFKRKIPARWPATAILQLRLLLHRLIKNRYNLTLALDDLGYNMQLAAREHGWGHRHVLHQAKRAGLVLQGKPQLVQPSRLLDGGEERLVEGHDFLGLGRYLILPKRFFAKEIHHLGDVYALGAARVAHLAGEAHPDGERAQHLLLELWIARLKHAHYVAWRELHFCSQGAARRTLATLVALVNVYPGCSQNFARQAAYGLMVNISTHIPEVVFVKTVFSTFPETKAPSYRQLFFLKKSGGKSSNLIKKANIFPLIFQAVNQLAVESHLFLQTIEPPCNPFSARHAADVNQGLSSQKAMV